VWRCGPASGCHDFRKATVSEIACAEKSALVRGLSSGGNNRCLHESGSPSSREMHSTISWRSSGRTERHFQTASRTGAELKIRSLSAVGGAFVCSSKRARQEARYLSGRES